MADMHILNVNVLASILLTGGVLKYPNDNNSFQFDIIDAIKDSHFEIKPVEFSKNAVVMLTRLKARLKAEINEKTGKRTSCNMSISPNRHNLRAMKIDHMEGEKCFLVTATNHGTFIIHTGNSFPAITNKDEVACITINLKKVNDAFELNELFEIIPS
jgi:hypothetical protein